MAFWEQVELFSPGLHSDHSFRCCRGEIAPLQCPRRRGLRATAAGDHERPPGQAEEVIYSANTGFAKLHSARRSKNGLHCARLGFPLTIASSLSTRAECSGRRPAPIAILLNIIDPCRLYSGSPARWTRSPERASGNALNRTRHRPHCLDQWMTALAKTMWPANSDSLVCAGLSKGSRQIAGAKGNSQSSAPAIG